MSEFWTWLNYISIVAGIIGAFASIVAAIFAMNVKKKINQILDRQDFRENLKKLMGQSTGYIDVLKSDKNDMSSLNIQITGFIAEVRYRYSFLPFKIKIIIFQIKRCKLDTQPTLKQRKKLIELLTHFQAILEKEGKL